MTPEHAAEPAIDPAAAPVIDVRSLTKRYGDRDVLTGLDLTIQPGETYALLGPNGAGKSTAIEILEGLRSADAGEVTVLGHDPRTAPRSWRARIGIVPQSTGEFGAFTPTELLRHYAGFYPNARPVDEVIELVGLAEKARTRASKLSGGQQRRLDVALGIIGRPELLFLDEPTTGFDPEARRQFWNMLQSLAGSGTAILLTTHYLDEAATLADRVGVLSRGRLVAEAPPEEIGGAEARIPVVRWRDADGRMQELRTEHPGRATAKLVAELGEPRGLEVVRPSLEETYLGLIGATPTQSELPEGTAREPNLADTATEHDMTEVAR